MKKSFPVYCVWLAILSVAVMLGIVAITPGAEPEKIPLESIQPELPKSLKDKGWAISVISIHENPSLGDDDEVNGDVYVVCSLFKSLVPASIHEELVFTMPGFTLKGKKVYFMVFSDQEVKDDRKNYEYFKSMSEAKFTLLLHKSVDRVSFLRLPDQEIKK